MTALRLTPPQKKAVEAAERTVFVSAGAGSGKTSVLVERYLRLVLDSKASPREVAAVTFTRKAAGELRQRIRLRLLEGGYRETAEEIDQAPIGTIHSLCARILRAQGLVRGLQPDFRVLDESGSAILLDAAFQEAWERVVSTAGPEEMEILARHGDMLREAVPAAFGALRGLGQRLPALHLPSPGDLDGARSALEAVLEHLDQRVACCALTSKTSEQNYQKACLCRKWLSSCQPSLSSILDAAKLVPHMRGNEAKQLFTDVKEALLEMCRALGERYAAVVGVVAERLVRELGAVYMQLKAERNALDFADLEIEALEALVRAEGEVESLHLLVDEFQDTNELQCRLLDLLRPLTLMSVGDYFQSIYGFRNADCEVFRARRDALWGDEEPLRTLPEEWVSSSRSARYVSLSTSFRASEGLLAVINRMFGSGAFFGEQYEPLAPWPTRKVDKEYATAVYDPVAELHIVGRSVDGSGGAPSEEDELVRQITEPVMVAERVRRLINQEGWSARHIAILLRKIVNAHQYVAELEARGVDTYLVGGRGYFSKEEIADLTALLTLLVDPHADMSLVIVLRSPMVGLTDDGLAHLGFARRRGKWPSLWAALEGEVRASSNHSGLLAPVDLHKVRRLMGAVADLSRRVGSPGLSGLIDAAAQALDHDLLSLAAVQGKRRYANVRKLMRLAESFEEVEGPDLAAFLRYVSRRGSLDDREGEATVLAEEEDVVRIMTVHQAKGLEFPVVVYAGLGELPGGSSPALVVGADGTAGLRISLRGKFSALGGRVSLGPYNELTEVALARGREEEARISYVAATRAQERLILVGSRHRRMSRLTERPLLWFGAAAGLSEEDIMSGSFRGERLPDLGLEITSHEDVELDGAVSPAHAGDTAAPESLLGDPKRLAPPVFPQPSHSPPQITSVSFSALALYERCPQRYFLERVLGLSTPLSIEQIHSDELDPADHSGGDGVGAVKRGLVVHKMLELADLSGPMPSPATFAALYHQAESTLGVELTKGEQERCVNLVSAFWRSPLALLDLQTARRELSFAFGVDGVVVSGVMDLVVATAEEMLIVDYKTNRLPDGDPSSVVSHYVKQAALYALAGLKKGAQAVSVDFLFLELPEKPVRITYTRDDIARLEGWLSEALRGLIAGEFPKKDVHCRLCPHFVICGGGKEEKE